MSFIPIAIECLKLTVMAIILYYVCEKLEMPPVPKIVCQMAIIAIAIIAAIQIALAAPAAVPRNSSLGSTPTIIAPEKR